MTSSSPSPWATTPETIVEETPIRPNHTTGKPAVDAYLDTVTKATTELLRIEREAVGVYLNTIYPGGMEHGFQGITDPNLILELEFARKTVRATAAWIAASALASCIPSDINGLPEELQEILPHNLLVEASYDELYKRLILDFITKMTAKR
jgi:hypothetical protein